MLLRSFHSSAVETSVGDVGTSAATDAEILNSVVVLAEGQKATKNGRGQQMATKSPLFETWLAGAHQDKTESPVLLDVGAAYGINSVAAAKRGAPHVIAADVDARHLAYVGASSRSQAVEDRVETLAIDYLPAALPLEDQSVSSILAAEVLHFLRGPDVIAALREFQRVLRPGGVLAITMATGRSDEEVFFSHENYAIYRRGVDALLAEGRATTSFPGELEADTMRALWSSLRAKGYDLPEESWNDFLHVMEPDHLQAVLESVGFAVVSAKAAAHPGYPSLFSGPHVNAQVVAVKRG